MGKANVVQSIYSNQWCWYTDTLNLWCYMRWNWLDSIRFRCANTFDTIYNFSFDSIPQDHSEYNSFDTMFDFHIAENWVWNFAIEGKHFIAIEPKSMCVLDKDLKCRMRRPRQKMLFNANKTLHGTARRDTMCFPRNLFMFFFSHLIGN